MAWKVTFPTGETVLFDDLPPAVFGDLAAADETASWYGVYMSPTSDHARMQRVLVKSAQVAGIEPPAEPATVREAAERIGWFTQEPDVADKPFMNGNPQMPDAPEVGSTSGAPGDSDGLPTSSTDNPSEPS